MSLEKVEHHQKSLKFITDRAWAKFARSGDSAEPPRAVLLWITPERDPVLPRANEVPQRHLELSVFEGWVGSKLCRYADSVPPAIVSVLLGMLPSRPYHRPWVYVQRIGQADVQALVKGREEPLLIWRAYRWRAWRVLTGLLCCPVCAGCRTDDLSRFSRAHDRYGL